MGYDHAWSLPSAKNYGHDATMRGFRTERHVSVRSGAEPGQGRSTETAHRAGGGSRRGKPSSRPAVPLSSRDLCCRRGQERAEASKPVSLWPGWRPNEEVVDACYTGARR